MIEAPTRTIDAEVSRAALVYGRRYPYESEHAKYPDEAAEANVALPKIGGLVLLIAAERLGTKVTIHDDVTACRLMYPKVIDSLQAQHGLEAAMRVNALAIQMVGDMEDINGGFKDTLTGYMSLRLERERRC